MPMAKPRKSMLDDDTLAREIKPTRERMAHDEIRKVEIEGRQVRKVSDSSSLALLYRRGVVDDDQYAAGVWLQASYEKSLHSIGSVELRERVDGGGVISPEVIIAAGADVRAAMAVVIAEAGQDEWAVVELVCMFDQTLTAVVAQMGGGRRQTALEVAAERLRTGLNALAEWRVNISLLDAN